MPNSDAFADHVQATEAQSHRGDVTPNHNAITQRIIGCAIEVHKALGSGLLQSVYDSALAIEFDHVRLRFTRQLQVPAVYRGRPIGHYRIDFVVEQAVVVEVKSVERFDPVFDSQVLTYMRVADVRLGLLLNFNSRLLVDGIRRFIL